MSWAEATDPANLLCYEMNGQPLPAANGFPLRLIAPRWFGISNVKWLTRIEVTDERFMGPFMAQRYMTVREVPGESGRTVWTRTAVGRSLLKSVAAKVTLQDGKYRIYGAAWGAPIARVEVRVDDGPWKTAAIDRGGEHEFAWKFWHLDWASPVAGEHRITSRAIDKAGRRPAGQGRRGRRATKDLLGSERADHPDDPDLLEAIPQFAAPARFQLPPGRQLVQVHRFPRRSGILPP